MLRVLQGDVVYSCCANFFSKPPLLATAGDRITGCT